MKKSLKKEIDAYLAEQVPKLVRIECAKIDIDKQIKEFKARRLLISSQDIATRVANNMCFGTTSKVVCERRI